MNPDQIGPYKITGPPVGGGMSIVYPAIQPGTNRMVALKVLAPHLEHDPSAVERFRQEAQAAARLKQHNIVTIYEANTTSPPYYIAMEFLEGGTLADRIRNGLLKPEQALAIIRQICTGLDHAHRHHVVHRDIKPANIMFDAEGKVAVTDFGISRVLDKANLTLPGARTGTAEYMSPEQAKGEEADSRSDLYSLGVVAYEMLTGRVPFSNPRELVTMRQIVDDPIPPPRTVNPSIPPAVETVLLKSLEKDPRKRYQNGAEFFKALWAAYAGKTEPTRHPARTLALAASLIIIMCLAVFIVRAMISSPMGVPPPRPRQVPRLIGLSPKEAKSRHGWLQLALGNSMYDDTVSLGRICYQEPHEGGNYGGKAIQIRLSLGPKPPPPPQMARVEVCPKSHLLPGRWCRRGHYEEIARGKAPTRTCLACRESVQYITVRVCRHSGLLPGRYCNTRYRKFRQGKEPKSSCDQCYPPPPPPPAPGPPPP